MILDKAMSRGMGYSYWLAWVTCSPKEWVPESQRAARVGFVCVCVCGWGGGEMTNSKWKGWWSLKSVPSAHSPSDTVVKGHLIAPPPPKQKLKNSLCNSAEAQCVDYSSIPVLEHLQNQECPVRVWPIEGIVKPWQFLSAGNGRNSLADSSPLQPRTCRLNRNVPANLGTSGIISLHHTFKVEGELNSNQSQEVLRQSQKGDHWDSQRQIYDSLTHSEKNPKLLRAKGW